MEVLGWGSCMSFDSAAIEYGSIIMLGVAYTLYMQLL